jgi:hypothetical protein
MKRNCENLVLSLLIFLCLMIGCSAGSRVNGHVVDTDNLPIENATVKFEQVGDFHGDTTHQSIHQTWVDGGFGCEFLHAGFFEVPLRITVTKEGYKPYQIDFTSGEAHKKLQNKEEFRVVLEKE